VTIQFISQPADAQGCHILFVATDEKKTVGTLLPELKCIATLTVGETADFAEQGGMIRFCVEDDKMRFEIDPLAAERANLKISSRRLLLAKNVVGGRRQS
jgi:YfiR/HmsC-like